MGKFLRHGKASNLRTFSHYGVQKAVESESCCLFIWIEVLYLIAIQMASKSISPVKTCRITRSLELVILC